MEVLSGLALGFLGSLHCIGMCGPIALALPSRTKSKFDFYCGRILYNLGRVFAYSILGLLLGLMGQRINLAGYQQTLSIILGIIILITVLNPVRFKHFFSSLSFVKAATIFLQLSIGSLFRKSNQSSLFLIGVLNGFLPCGFVYIALAGAIAFGKVEGSILFMTLFGIGTSPAMFSASIVTSLFSQKVRKKIIQSVPVFAFVLAIIFILRGLNLGIPYLSPKLKPVMQIEQINRSQKDCCE